MDEVPLEISIEELDRMRNEGEPHTLLDIREPHELRISALSGSLDIPMGSVSGAPGRIAEKTARSPSSAGPATGA